MTAPLDDPRELASLAADTDAERARSSVPAALGTEDVPTCCLCGSTKAFPKFAVQDRLHRIPGRFGLVTCTACGLVRLSPRPTRDSLSEYYPAEDYYAYRPRGAGSQAAMTGGSLRSRARAGVRAAAMTSLGYPSDGGLGPVAALARRFTPRTILDMATYGWRGFPPYSHPGGRALDVGCGNGAFLTLLTRHGWDVYGVDASQAAASAAEARGVPVFVGEVQEAPLTPQSFAYVCMSHSIEHVWDPLEALQTVYELVEPGGRLYVETPNISSLVARRFGTYWFNLDSPRHLWLFNPTTLGRALRQSGFEVTELTSKSFGSRPLSTMRWESTFRVEESEGRALPNRPVLQSSDLVRAVSVAAEARVQHWIHPERDEIMCCWATRPLEPAI